MSLFWHFARRDLLDFMIGWVMLVATTLSCVFLRSEPTVVLGVLGYGYLVFSMIVSIYVWNAHRAYLLTLPVSRDAMFGLSAGRDAVATLPLFLFGVALFPQFLAHVARVPELERVPLGVYLDGAVFSAISIAFLKLIFLGPIIEGERMARTAGRSRRFAMIVWIFARLGVDMLFFTIWFVGFAIVYSGRYGGVYYGIPCLSAPYFGWKLYRFRRRWLFD